MRGRGLFILGAIAALVFAATPQGRKVVDQAKGKAQDLWARPDVQKTVSDVSAQVRANVPIVGEDLADAISRSQPRKTGSGTTGTGTSS